MVNKKGWIRIVEAFVAILLIAGVLLVVINKSNVNNDSLSEQVYSLQLSILREIQLDDGLREKIISSNSSDTNNPLPIKWEEFTNEGERELVDLKNRIESRIPEYLDCEARICSLERVCSLDKLPNKDIYSQSVAITATSSQYNPRQLKIFCWTKE